MIICKNYNYFEVYYGCKLHQQDIGSENGIRKYGEVLTAQKIRRGKIPVPMRKRTDPNELYYYFTVRKWESLPQTIEIQDTWKGAPQFTNKFLLDNCTKSYQLLAIASEEEYRLMVEINKAFDDLDASTAKDNTAAYRVNDTHTIAMLDGYFTIMNDSGDILDRISISNFAKGPRAGFNKIKKMIES